MPSSFPSFPHPLLAAAFLTLALGNPVRADDSLYPPPTVKIMPAGDSLTRGNNDINYPHGDIPGGYRKTLGLLLEQRNVSHDFVGEKNDNAAIGMDPDHNGNPGWRSDEILASLPGWLAEDPDIVLLIAGTNDILQRIEVATAIANMDTMITTVTNNAPHRKLYVGTIPPITQQWPPPGQGPAVEASVLNADAIEFNSQLRTLVQTRASAGIDVTLVDFNANLDYDGGPGTDDDFFQPGDGVHPGQAGYDQMAGLWYLALSPDLPLPLAPAGTPEAPDNLSLSVVSSSRINLSWSDNSTDESVFQIYQKSASGGVWEQAALLPADTTTHAVTGLDTATETYKFVVRAANASGYSLWSASATSSGGATPAVPAAPAGLAAAPLDSNHISLTWTVESDDEASFLIERKTGSEGDWEEVAAAPAASSSLVDSGLAAATEYYYRVRSSNETGSSPPSEEASATTGTASSWDLWTAAHPAFAALPAADREPSADPNHDGFSNLLAYAFGIDPMTDATPFLPTIESIPPDGLAYRFRRNTLAPDLNVEILASDDLEADHWSPHPATGSSTTAAPESSDSEIVTVPLIPDPAAPKRFYKLRVIRNATP